MRRVRIIHALRPFTGRLAAAFVLLGGSLYLLGREVFVAQIVRNVPRTADLSALLGFLESAFLNTTFLVQALTVLALIAGLWLVRECARLTTASNSRYA